MSIRVTKIKGMTENVAKGLKAQGITMSDELVAAARTASDRKELSGKLGIQPAQLLEYANRADLARVKGIGAVYGDLLERAGVDTVRELATRNPENLHAKILSLMVNSPAISRPSVQKIADWVSQAKALGTGLEY